MCAIGLVLYDIIRPMLSTVTTSSHVTAPSVACARVCLRAACRTQGARVPAPRCQATTAQPEQTPASAMTSPHACTHVSHRVERVGNVAGPVSKSARCSVLACVHERHQPIAVDIGQVPERGQRRQHPPRVAHVRKLWKCDKDVVTYIVLLTFSGLPLRPPLGNWRSHSHLRWVMYHDHDHSALYTMIAGRCR